MIMVTMTKINWRMRKQKKEEMEVKMVKKKQKVKKKMKMRKYIKCGIKMVTIHICKAVVQTGIPAWHDECQK